MSFSKLTVIQSLVLCIALELKVYAWVDVLGKVFITPLGSAYKGFMNFLLIMRVKEVSRFPNIWTFIFFLMEKIKFKCKYIIS